MMNCDAVSDSDDTLSVPKVKHVTLPEASVRVAAGPDKGTSAVLESGSLLIGTGDDCGLKLSDETVSEHHCELTLRDGFLIVRDLGSTNGVQLGELLLREAVVPNGTKLTLGRTQIVVEAKGKTKVEVASDTQLGALYGKSAAMRTLFARLAAIAGSTAPALIEGETGVGKDLCAEALHRLGPRAKGPLVVLDCGAVTETLLEAELFGAERGAFTGAVATRDGLAEAADGGTLVIDEIGELPLELQPKLLRLIEKKELRRVGGTASRSVDIRVVASTNRELKHEVKAGRFREDLYYRLSALRVRVPPLRARLEDLPGLVDELMKRSGSGRRFDALPESVKSMLGAHRWPGNVRELRNVVERLLTFPDEDALLDPAASRSGDDLKASSLSQSQLLPLSQARERNTDAFEQRYVKELLHRAGGSVVEAARLAGVSRQFLNRLMRKHDVRRS
jgi:DNA-binding NtrC family response regulator